MDFQVCEGTKQKMGEISNKLTLRQLFCSGWVTHCGSEFPVEKAPVGDTEVARTPFGF